MLYASQQEYLLELDYRVIIRPQAENPFKVVYHIPNLMCSAILSAGTRSPVSGDTRNLSGAGADGATGLDFGAVRKKTEETMKEK